MQDPLRSQQVRMCVCLYLCLFFVLVCLMRWEDATQEEIDKILHEVTAGEDVCLLISSFFMRHMRVPFRRRLTRSSMRSLQVRMLVNLFAYVVGLLLFFV